MKYEDSLIKFILKHDGVKIRKLNQINFIHFREYLDEAAQLTKYLSRNQSETLTSAIKTGTSTNGPITAAKASPEFIPNTAMATAIASSKLLLAAVNESVAVLL